MLIFFGSSDCMHSLHFLQASFEFTRWIVMDQRSVLNSALVPWLKRETSHTHILTKKLLLLEQNCCVEKSPVDKLEILCIILNLY